MVHYDVVVVGMGPAGALAAFELSRLGRRVLAIEQAPFPQFKISGGVLTVRASKLIPFDFSGEIEQVIHGVTLNLRGEARFTFESPRPIAYTLSRDRFDFLLVSKAKESGALVLDKVSLLDWVEEEDQVRVFTSMGEWRCDYLIGADGANSLVRGKNASPREGSFFAGFESELRFHGGEKRGRSLIEIALGSAPDGFGWFFPKKDHYSIGVAAFQDKIENARALYAQFVEDQGVLAEASGQQVYPYQRPIFMERFPLHHGRSLWVGEAAGLVDPFSGEGLYHAMRSGLAAARVVSGALKSGKKDLSPYTDRMRREVDDEFRSARRFARLILGAPQTSYHFLQNHKWVIELYFEILRGRERYHHAWEVIRGEWESFASNRRLKKESAHRKKPLSSLLRRGSELLFGKEAPPFYLTERRGRKRR